MTMKVIERILKSCDGGIELCDQDILLRISRCFSVVFPLGNKHIEPRCKIKLFGVVAPQKGMYCSLEKVDEGLLIDDEFVTLLIYIPEIENFYKKFLCEINSILLREKDEDVFLLIRTSEEGSMCIEVSSFD